MKKKIFIAALLLVMLLNACSGKEEKISDKSGMELTTKERTVITIFTDNSANYMDDLLKVITVKFPQYKFEVEIPAINNYFSTELSRRISHGDVSDIVLSHYLSPDMHNIDSAFQDLSGKPYSANYKTAFLKDTEKNGKIFFLPLVEMVDGIVYNKTLFDEKGWAIPTNYDEYIALNKKIIAAGYGTSATKMSSDRFVHRFERCYMLDLGWKLPSYNWLIKFNNRSASVYDMDWTAVFNDFDDALAARKASLIFSKSTNDQNEMLLRSFAMMENSISLFSQMPTGTNMDQFRLMPFWGRTSEGGWLFSNGITYMAASSAAMSNPDKAKAIDSIFSYLSTSDGQKLINTYTYNVISPLTGAGNEINNDILTDVQQQISEGKILNYDEFTNCTSALRESLNDYNDGKITRDEVLAALEKANQSEDLRNKVIARATADFSYDNMNALVLHAMREKTGSDISLNFKNVPYTHVGNIPYFKRIILSKFYQGNVTESDLESCIAKLEYGNLSVDYPVINMLIYTMTGRQILAALDYNEGLYMGSGLTMKYSWNTEKNTYLASGFTLDNGKIFNLDSEYTVAANSVLRLKENSYIKKEKYSEDFFPLVQDWINEKKTLSPEDFPDAVFDGKPEK